MILVTGGTGLVGAAAVRELARRGTPVAVLSRDASKVARRFPNLTIEARQGDVGDAASLRAAFAGVEAVINCVQFPNSPIENKRKGWTFEQVDYQGTVRQVEAANEAGVRRFVYVSGVGAAADAEKHWFVFKWRAEEAVRTSGMPYVIVRPTWVYGPEDASLNRFLGFARRLPFVPMFGDGKQLMQPLFIDDLGRLLVDALERSEAENQTFEAGGPERQSMDDVIKAALDVAGRRRPILHQPVALGKLLGTLLQLLPGPPLTSDAIDFITNEAVADNTALESAFAPKLTPLRVGLATYLGTER
ncbi:MAG: NAD(P)H-binding protein [Chloroflexi bacterium]|nr:NAD(P)H-binding protein [Chloroflexota bacterium]